MPEVAVQEKLSALDLLAVIRRSGLVDAEQLKESLANLPLDRTTGDEIAARLVEWELATFWQAQQLLKGRWKGFHLGKYRLLRELGRGGMAKVFLARHETLQSHVAIKVLTRSRMQKSSMEQRFLREARAAAQISHPNIVRVFDVDAEDDRHYLVMEYVQGRSLQELVDDEGVLTFRRAADFARQAAEGLARAHEAGLIHRDIKPANLLVEEGRIIKIADFGLARVEAGDEDGSLTMQHEEKVLGTADYIAPEQAINSHHIDARADQYSLGYTLYFMLTGQAPFPTGRVVERLTKHCTIDPKRITEFRPDAPDDLIAIVHRLTRKTPHERYKSMAEVAEALRRCSLTPGSGEAITARSHSAEEALLTLAPEEDERPKRERREKAASSEPADSATPTAAADSASLSSDLSPVKESPAILEESLPSAASATADGGANAAFSPLLDELLDDVDFPSATDSAGTPGRLGSDIHGSDALGSLGPLSALRDTDATSPLPTSTMMGNNAEVEKPQKSFFAEIYASMKRGEYPLWILIAAGLILGGILLFIAFSYATSFEPPTVPDRIGEI